jgi:6,7-dimethyl-8-ribityllumazine synthase
MNKNKLKVKVIVADYYKEITDSLTLSAISLLKKNKIKYEIIKVPGVYEIPQMIKWCINPKGPNLFIALGCVIKGQTYHFEVISDSVGYSLLDLVNSNPKTLITNGIINANNKNQALKRSKSDNKNKGQEAASALIRMIQCLI